MKKENVLVSACLVGIKCRYDGTDAYCPKVEKLLAKYTIIPFCPEVLAGLKTPRAAVEIVGGRAKTKDGRDQSKQFQTGARKSLEMAKNFKVKKALLKSGSPSCGCDLIYDGTFSNKQVKRTGFVAELFNENGIKIFSENFRGQL